MFKSLSKFSLSVVILLFFIGCALPEEIPAPPAVTEEVSTPAATAPTEDTPTDTTSMLNIDKGTITLDPDSSRTLPEAQFYVHMTDGLEVMFLEEVTWVDITGNLAFFIISDGESVRVTNNTDEALTFYFLKMD